MADMAAKAKHATPDDRHEAQEQAKDKLETLARFGYAAKGVVYLTVGILAAMAAFGGPGDGETGGSKNALAAIVSQAPLGNWLVGLIGIGLAGYAVWQFVRAAMNPEHDGAGKRVFYAISGVLHTLLVIFCFGLIFGGQGSGGGSEGGSGGGGEGGPQGFTATVMSYPWGQWLVGIIGIGIAGFGVQQLIKAFKAKVAEKLALYDLSAKARDAVVQVGRVGIAARGVVFGIIGVSFVVVAWQHDPSEARGLGGALRTLQDQPWGWVMLGIVALGLIAYGLYEFVKARYRIIHVEG